MDDALREKAVFITGGGSGIGRATALAAARAGGRVALADRDEASVHAAACEIESFGKEAIALVGDVTRPSDVERMVAAVVQHFGRIDCAFNNAGISPVVLGAGDQKVADLSEEGWRTVIATNLDGVWRCMKHEIAQMLKQGAGTIVNTASIAGLVGLRNRGAYVASKHAVVGLTKAAALDYGSSGIRINAICPGYIKTPLSAETTLKLGDAILARTPLQRLGTPEEIAQAVIWLFSDHASFVTGTAFAADGGYTAV